MITTIFEYAAVTTLEYTLVTGVRFLAIGVGLVIVASMGYAGFQYLTAGDNPNQVSAAKQRIFQLVISLLLYIFGFTFLNFLTPGGLF